MKRILVLGATGSIGTSGLDVIENNPSRFKLAGLSAHKNLEKLKQIATKFNCDNFCLTGLDSGNFIHGEEGLIKLIETSDCDIVLNGIAGAAGLRPSITALNCGKDLALANKETIVMAGYLVKALAKKNNCRILPVDSEHSAIFNLIEKYGKEYVDSIVLTASGGAFRDTPKEQLANVTVKDALKHPTWNMGPKITIDSASLANKGLEVIEAVRLFDVDADHVDVVIHPQSLIHSLIRTKDGVLYAQISKPDMRHPILSAFTWPEYVPNHLEVFDIAQCAEMTFKKPRYDDFRMLPLAREAAKKSGCYTIAYNAANVEAVSAFIIEKIKFTDIPIVTEQVLQADWTKEPSDFDEVFAADKLARQKASDFISGEFCK